MLVYIARKAHWPRTAMAKFIFWLAVQQYVRDGLRHRLTNYTILPPEDEHNSVRNM